MPLEIAVGAVGAIAVVALSRATRFDRALVLSLIALPLVYAAFALVDGQPGQAALEIAAGVPFLVAGVVLSPDRPRLLAVAGGFWLAHAVFDLVRDGFLDDGSVPGWYPTVCLGFDVVVGVYLLVRSRRPRAVPMAG